MNSNSSVEVIPACIMKLAASRGISRRRLLQGNACAPGGFGGNLCGRGDLRRDNREVLGEIKSQNPHPVLKKRGQGWGTLDLNFLRCGYSANQVFLFLLAFGSNGKGVEHTQGQRVLEGFVLALGELSLTQDLHSNHCFSRRLHFL